MAGGHPTTLVAARHSGQGDLSNSEELAHIAAEIADGKKAEDIVILDMRGLVDYTDFLVICTGRTPRQTKAIAADLRHQLKHVHGLPPRRIEGEKEGDWILVDAFDVIIHVFTPEAHQFYRLDRLWREAPHTRFESAAIAAGTSDTASAPA